MNNTLKYFILKHFFGLNNSLPGATGIAKTLLEKGECIVAGTDRIWIGGIGNFIDVNPVEGAEGCSLYKFNKEEFLTSAWFKDIRKEYATDENRRLQEELRATKKQIEDLSNLFETK